MKIQPFYTMDNTIDPPSFLPTDLDTSILLDITRIGDEWRRYIHPHTGKIHDCAEYVKQSKREYHEAI